MKVMSTAVPVGSLVEAPSTIHRIFVIDCSGSMYGELPLIRSQMKNKIPQLTNVGDTVSIIWFSGRKECGILQEGIEVKNISSFNGMNDAVDKFLRPICLTGFKDPIDLAATTATKLKKKYSGSAAHMFFMTDGYDNQWSKGDILSCLKEAADAIDSMTFVEYGWYCNRPLMTSMAESVGAPLVFSEKFEDYDGVFENNLVKKIISTKKVEVSVPGATLGYAFTYQDNEILCHLVDNKKVLVPEGTKEVHYFTEGTGSHPSDEVSYAAMYTLAQRMLSVPLLDILGGVGDVSLIDMFNNCFSKQDYSDFQQQVLFCVLDQDFRYKAGKNTSYLPPADAFTVIDLLDELASDKGNKFFPYDTWFQYERISAARVDSSEVVDTEARDAILEKIAGTKSAKEVAALSEQLASLADKATSRSLKFTPLRPEQGYSITSLTFNETRPNISIQICIPGTVELPTPAMDDNLVDTETGEVLDPYSNGVPVIFPTKIYRNYAVVKDGIKHSSLANLPVSLTASTLAKLEENGVTFNEHGFKNGSVLYLNAKALPVVNREMTTEVSAEEFFKDVVNLIQEKSSQKVLNKFRKEFSTTSTGLATQYGPIIVNWLKELGLTDMGFSPKTVKGESLDVYTAKEFKVSVAKCSSIPTINDALLTKIKTASKAPTLSESLCVPMISKYLRFIESDVYKDAANKEALLSTWLDTESQSVTQNVRSLIRSVAKTKFAIMVGHIWFKEFDSLDQNSMDVVVGDQTFSCKAEIRDIEVAV